MAKKKKGRKGRKAHGKKKAWCVKSGKTTVSRHRKKSSAKKVKNRRHKAGKKARVIAC
jgi:hypothetical protein